MRPKTGAFTNPHPSSNANSGFTLAARGRHKVASANCTVRLTYVLLPVTICDMAMRTSAITSDDLDGSSNAETVTFGFDGAAYEIDLAPKNRAKLEKALAPYVEVARRVSVRSRRPAARRATAQDNAAIRAWAKSKNMKVSERGRISSDIISQYQAQH
jgi:Lsr2